MEVKSEHYSEQYGFLSSQVSDRDYGYAQHAGEVLEILASLHLSIGGDQLTEDPRGVKTGELRQLNHRLGVTPAPFQPLFFGAKEDKMPGAGQVSLSRKNVRV